ncbi:MAG: hypothetical protein JWR35_1997 [Marmoricola sp.]|jgi:hypothetical protein|nr:hypothetical protein [Marmoricola sp.]
MAKAAKAPKTPKAPKKPGRIAQVRQSYQVTKKGDPHIGGVLFGTFIIGAAVGFTVVYFLLGQTLLFPIVIGVLTGLLTTVIIFGRRAMKSQLSQMEGQPGAAAGALGMLRRGWKTDPAIAFNKNQDIVHRVVGPPGIVLIGEGNQHRLKPLLLSERRKHERVASETPIHEVIVGNEAGEVPLDKLVKHVTKLGKDLKPAQMTDVLARLRALDANRSNIPIPKGPMPTSMKGARQNMRGR